MLKEYAHRPCNVNASKDHKKPNLSSVFKKIFSKSKSSKHMFVKYGEQMVQSGTVTVDNLRTWVKLIQSEDNGKNVYKKKHYDIFNKVKVDEKTFEYILSLQSIETRQSPAKTVGEVDHKKSGSHPYVTPTPTTSTGTSATSTANTSASNLQSLSMPNLGSLSTSKTKQTTTTATCAPIMRNDQGQFIMLSILYRLMFTVDNIIHFADLDTLNNLSNLYIFYLKLIMAEPASANQTNQTNDNSTEQGASVTLNMLSLQVLAILLKLFENETLVPLYFNSKMIEALVTLCIEKDNLRDRLKDEEIGISDDIVTLLATYFKREPCRSIIERHPEWLELILKASSRNIKVHREVNPENVIFGDMLYESPLCTVYQGRFEGNDVAIKQQSVEGLCFEWPAFFREITIACVSQHPRVVKCLGACTENTTMPYIVTELCSRGNLMRALDSYVKERHEAPPLYLIHNMAAEAAQALEFIHSKSLIHRDVKSANFLVKDDFSVKLIDFGTSKMMQNQLNMTVIGTPIYMAEEVIRGEKYQQSADVYSFGIVLWELFTREKPFDGMHEFERVTYVLKGGRPAIPDTVPPIISELIQRCWHANPTMRPNFKSVLKTLYVMSHPAPLESVLTVVPMVDVNVRMCSQTLKMMFILMDFPTLMRCSQVSRMWRRAVFLAVSDPDTKQPLTHFDNNYWTPMINHSIGDLKRLMHS
ncbi:hypothetical protein SAMD00019534_041190 [Acytostelium subglobosum LB1]|uniref:hypothetical protein n=1 Tax=Acytostelium subglobosum LB1 TaxID=1410327 RepID=UPI000644D8EE|nr:hypothetical protein SAMD00019534_041190 [Acytostelium subglobosum LB1]GAM20944.1 hypothetical protein SAMD00019534_041190 [Acytostelium subglobosum LB1]|eukprot:XP_012756078.1 hypothetical protein SAMD00019534_041190 [Acytostelium subglobosum LB1]